MSRISASKITLLRGETRRFLLTPRCYLSAARSRWLLIRKGKGKRVASPLGSGKSPSGTNNQKLLEFVLVMMNMIKCKEKTKVSWRLAVWCSVSFAVQALDPLQSRRNACEREIVSLRANNRLQTIPAAYLINACHSRCKLRKVPHRFSTMRITLVT